jgi:hypothetical protein
VVIDERGRLFGKVNIIDAAVGLVVLLLIPLAYGTYRLFRVPTPTIAALELLASPGGGTTGGTPGEHIQIPFGATKGLHVRLTGEHLRPSLRAYVGVQEASYLFESPTGAEIALPNLAAGSYDVVLYDEVREIFRGRAALTVAVITSDIEVTMRCLVRPEVLPLLIPASQDDRTRPQEARIPTLISVRVLERLGNNTSITIVRDHVMQDRRDGPFNVVMAVVRVVAAQTSRGWLFGNDLLRAGAYFSFETPEYQMLGEIVGIKPARQSDVR